MNRKDLEVYVARTRKEFAAAYESQRVAGEHAVMLMRRLELAEALLDTFTDADISGSARLTEAPKTGNRAAPAPSEPPASSGVPCPEPGCTFIASNPAGLSIHKGRMHKAVPRAAVSNIRGGDSTANVGPAPTSAPKPPPSGSGESMEWDLPKRRRTSEPAPDLPRRAVPRAHGGRDLVAL